MVKRWKKAPPLPEDEVWMPAGTSYRGIVETSLNARNATEEEEGQLWSQENPYVIKKATPSNLTWKTPPTSSSNSSSDKPAKSLSKKKKKKGQTSGPRRFLGKITSALKRNKQFTPKTKPYKFTASPYDKKKYKNSILSTKRKPLLARFKRKNKEKLKAAKKAGKQKQKSSETLTSSQVEDAKGKGKKDSDDGTKKDKHGPKVKTEGDDDTAEGEKDPDQAENDGKKGEGDKPETAEDKDKTTAEKSDLVDFLADAGMTLEDDEAMGNAFLRSLKLVTFVARILGRHPFKHRKTKNGFVEFYYVPTHCMSVWFLVCNILLTILFVAGIYMSFFLWMNIPLTSDRGHLEENVVKRQNDLNALLTPAQTKVDFEEAKDIYLRNRQANYIFARHITIFLAEWCFLLHDVISGWHLYVNRHGFVNYLNFWSRATVTMSMDVTKGVKFASIRFLGFFFCCSMIRTFVSYFKLVPSSTGSAAMVALILVRDFNSGALKVRTDQKHCFLKPPCLKESFTIMMDVSRVIQFYMFISSKIFLLFFYMFNMYLVNAFSEWNGRLYATVLRGGDFISTSLGRTTYGLLFKDHCILLDLLEATDRSFTSVVESFFGLQALNLCFELYFTANSARYGGNEEEAEAKGYFVRPWDWSIGLFSLVVNTVLMVELLKSSASVGEEAMSGLEVLRRKTMLGRKTDEELYFLLSMFASYTSYKPLGLEGGGFFQCNKEFSVGVLNTIISYFTIVYQFKPKLDFGADASKDTKREDIQKFLQVVENRTHYF